MTKATRYEVARVRRHAAVAKSYHGCATRKLEAEIQLTGPVPGVCPDVLPPAEAAAVIGADKDQIHCFSPFQAQLHPTRFISG
jgi:hypothetical protein